MKTITIETVREATRCTNPRFAPEKREAAKEFMAAWETMLSASNAQEFDAAVGRIERLRVQFQSQWSVSIDAPLEYYKFAVRWWKSIDVKLSGTAYRGQFVSPHLRMLERRAWRAVRAQLKAERAQAEAKAPAESAPAAPAQPELPPVAASQARIVPNLRGSTSDGVTYHPAETVLYLRRLADDPATSEKKAAFLRRKAELFRELAVECGVPDDQVEAVGEALTTARKSGAVVQLSAQVYEVLRRNR
jgi:hypothetical protein